MKDICVECIAMQMNLYSELSKDEKLAKAKALVIKYNSSLILGKILLVYYKDYCKFHSCNKSVRSTQSFFIFFCFSNDVLCDSHNGSKLISCFFITWTSFQVKN